MSEGARSGTRMGTSIGRHHIVRLIGTGRSGRVFECVGPDDKRVAVKVMRSGRVQDAERIHRERLTFERIRSNHVVQIFDVPVFNNSPYVVMELVDGESLASWLERGALRTIDVLHVVRAVATGLRDAWALGVAHGDLRPRNVLIPQARLEAAKVVDLGLAPLVDGTDGLRGTPEYMAPELLLGAPPDAGSDLYALGCMLYELLSGHPPFAGAAAAVMKAQAEQQPRSLDAAMPGAPHFMVDFVERLLDKDRARRIKSWQECLVAVDHALQGLKLPPPPKPELPELDLDVDEPSGAFDGARTLEVHSSPPRDEPVRDDPSDVIDVAAGLDSFTPVEFSDLEELLDDDLDDPFAAPPPVGSLPSPPAGPAASSATPQPSPASPSWAAPPPTATAPAVDAPAASTPAGTGRPSAGAADVFATAAEAPPPSSAPRGRQVTTTADAGALLDELFGGASTRKR